MSPFTITPCGPYAIDIHGGAEFLVRAPKSPAAARPESGSPVSSDEDPRVSPPVSEGEGS